MAEALKKRMTGEKIPDIKSVSPDMNCIMDKLLAYEPENRYQTTVQLETDLEHCLQRSSENNWRICQPLQPDESTLKIQGRERQEESEQDWKRDLAKDMLWGSAMFIISVLIMLGVTGIWSQKEQQIVSQVETEPQNICESTDWEKIQQTKVEDIVTASTENVTEIPNEVTEHVPTEETEKGEIGKNAEEVKETKESTTEPVKRAKKQERITEYRTKDENMDEEYTGHILRQPDEVRKTEKTATEESKEDLFEEENDIFK